MAIVDQWLDQVEELIKSPIPELMFKQLKIVGERFQARAPSERLAAFLNALSKVKPLPAPPSLLELLGGKTLGSVKPPVRRDDLSGAKPVQESPASTDE